MLVLQSEAHPKGRRVGVPCVRWICELLSFIDLWIYDITLPDLSLFELLLCVRSRWPILLHGFVLNVGMREVKKQLLSVAYGDAGKRV